jgi:hypothetical protein
VPDAEEWQLIATNDEFTIRATRFSVKRDDHCEDRHDVRVIETARPAIVRN